MFYLIYVKGTWLNNSQSFVTVEEYFTYGDNPKVSDDTWDDGSATQKALDDFRDNVAPQDKQCDYYVTRAFKSRSKIHAWGNH